MNKKTIVIICLLFGYWMGNLFTSQSGTQIQQKEIEKINSEKMYINSLYMKCEERYAILKNGNVAMVEKMEKELDNGSGW